MGGRKLTNPMADDVNKRPFQHKKNNESNSVLARTQTRRGEAQRAQRRTSENVNVQSSQHVINVPVNKSIYNGYQGQQFSLSGQKRQPAPTDGKKLRIIPLGGLGEMGIGKNMMALEYDNEIVVIDMGFLFPGPDYPGINYITPDIAWLEANKHKIKGHAFTHAHLDHIGAFRHLIHRLPAPVYGTEFTLSMLQKNMEEATSGFTPTYHEVNPHAHERIQLGQHFNIEFIHVNHSIPGSTAIVIRTPVGVVVNTGDWRFEDDPVDGKKFDLDRMTEIASKEGILMLMNESTNCETEGTHMHSEKDIQESFEQVMREYQNNRLIVSTFSSQLHRIQLLLEAAKNNGRKVAFAGYSMIQNLEVALKTNTIKVPKDVVVKMEDLIKLPDGKVMIICTGSQGEFNAVLNRMANGSHKHIKTKNTDVVILSSSIIPGNDKFIVRTIDGLMREGSEVIQDKKTHLTGIGPLHMSGHGYYDDHVKLINALNPTFYMPIHGEFHHLVHNAELAEKEAAIPRANIFVSDNGDVVEIDHNKQARKTGRIPVGGVMYDDSGAIVSEVVLKDRIHMSNEGMFIVVLTVNRRSGRLLTSPDIISRGFIYLRDSEELMGTIRQYLKQKVARAITGRKPDLDILKKELRDEITHILYDQTRRTPIVIPVINEVNENQDGGQGNRMNNARPQANSPRPAEGQQSRRPLEQIAQAQPHNKHMRET